MFPRRPPSPPNWKTQLIASFFLLLMFGLAVYSLRQKSPTFDEQGFIVRGLGYLRGENQHMRVGHPLGLNALNALLLVGDESIKLPTDDPSWQASSFHRPAELFLWEIGNDVEKVMFLARVPTVFLGLLLAAVAFRWARDVSGQDAAGLLALAFIALDPNILAHTRLTTTDLGITMAGTLAGYGLWRYLSKPTIQNVIIAAMTFGLLNNTKFTAGLFVPLFGIVIIAAWLHEIWQVRSLAPLKKHLPFMLLFPIISFLTLWGMYGFEISQLPANLPALPQLAGQTLPLARHLEQLLDIGNRSTKGAATFLLGSYSQAGWWYYFPVAFALKTPLVTLGMILVGLLKMFLVRDGKQAKSDVVRVLGVGDSATFTHQQFVTRLMLVAVPLGFLGFALVTSVNLGYRLILPILPYLILAGSVGIFASSRPLARREGQRSDTTATPLSFPRRQEAILFISLTLVLLITTFRIAPDFLAYFNSLAGGADNGWRALVDSNLDWGQDLQGLAEWVEESGTEEIWLSYFGEARPDYYGIPYRGLTSFPPRMVHPDVNPLYPSNPAPGIYAISATNLQGVMFDERDEFAWFRERDPFAKIGYSIFLYEVEPIGEPLTVLLPNMRLQEVAEGVFGTNQLRPIFYNPTTTTIFPVDGGMRMISAENHEPVPAAEPLTVTGDNGWQLLDLSVADTDPTQLTTRWQVQAQSDAALRIFVHALNSAGEIVTQSDILDVYPATLIRGDIVLQQHTLATVDGIVAYRVGLYDWQTEEPIGEPTILARELVHGE